MLVRSWGRKVGARLTPVPPLAMWRVRKPFSSQALSSFFPAWRDIMTVKVEPRAERTSARTARAGSAWYGRRRITSLLSVQARSMITGAVWELLLAVVVLAGGLALVVGAVVLAVRSGWAPAPWRGRR